MKTNRYTVIMNGRAVPACGGRLRRKETIQDSFFGRMVVQVCDECGRKTTSTRIGRYCTYPPKADAKK